MSEVVLKFSVLSNEMSNLPSTQRKLSIDAKFLPSVETTSFIINYLSFLKSIAKIKFQVKQSQS